QHDTFSFSFPFNADPPMLHSFPTRRSSDLDVVQCVDDDALQLSRIHPVPFEASPGRGRAPRREHFAGRAVQPLRSTAIQPVTFKDRKSTRLNSSHVKISYAVFCLKKKHNSM